MGFRSDRICDSQYRLEVVGLRPQGSGWDVATTEDTIHCGHVVNAAGAWGDEVAKLAGVPPIGLQPMRRTAFMVPGSDSYAQWPLTGDVESSFYFKPDGPQLLCSLAEEDLSEPIDARPRMEDVALAIDRINEATTLGIRTVRSQWVGLRTFSPDGGIVIGPDPHVDTFHWLVGLGGTGIQTAPAYGDVLARRITGQELSPEFGAAGVDPTKMSPARFL